RTDAERQADAFKGVRTSWRRSPSGVISGIKFDAHDRLASLADWLRDSSVVFPDTEIGIGATWKVTSEFDARGIHWNQTSTSHLTTLTGAAAPVDAETTIQAPSQAISVEPNATTTLRSGTGHGAGQMVIPLHGLVVTSTVQSTAEINLTIVRGSRRLLTS